MLHISEARFLDIAHPKFEGRLDTLLIDNFVSLKSRFTLILPPASSVLARDTNTERPSYPDNDDDGKMRIFLERCTLTLVNIFLPPLSVMLVAGVGTDALMNTLLFLCGVIPGHVHGFYITWTYFSRKKKVRKGRYPGGPKPLIYSKRVINGDASDERVRQLWMAEQRAQDEEELTRRQGGRRGTGSVGGTRRPPRVRGGGMSSGSQHKSSRWEV